MRERLKFSDVTDVQARAIKAILSNDEASTDAQLVAHLRAEFKLSAKKARAWVKQRGTYLRMEPEFLDLG